MNTSPSPQENEAQEPQLSKEQVVERQITDAILQGVNGRNGTNGSNGTHERNGSHRNDLGNLDLANAFRIAPPKPTFVHTAEVYQPAQKLPHDLQLKIDEVSGKVTVTTRKLLQALLNDHQEIARAFYEFTRFDNGTSVRFGRVQVLSETLVQKHPSVPRVLFYSLVEDLELGKDMEEVTEENFHELIKTIDASILRAAEKALNPEGFERLKLPLEDRRRIAAILNYRIAHHELDFVRMQVFEVLQEVIAEVSKANTEREMAKMFGPQDLTVGKDIDPDEEDPGAEHINVDVLRKLLGTKRAGQLLRMQFEEDVNAFDDESFDGLMGILRAGQSVEQEDPTFDEIPQAKELDEITGSVYSDDDLYGWLKEQEGQEDNDFLGDLPDWMRE